MAIFRVVDLPAPLGPTESEERTSLHPEVEVVDGDLVAEPTNELVEHDGGRVGTVGGCRFGRGGGGAVTMS